MDNVKNRHAISSVRRESICKVACNGIRFIGVEDELEKPHGDDIFAIVDVLNSIEEVADGNLNEWSSTLIAMIATVKNTMKRKYSVE